MTSIVFVLTVFATVFCFTQGESICTTNEGVSGTCKPFKECPALLKNADEKSGVIEKNTTAQCSTEEVCCPNNCFTPDGKLGSCVNIYSCEHLSNLLHDASTESEKQYVKHSRCNSNDKYSVCCGPPRDTSEVEPADNCTAILTAYPPDARTECCGKDNRVGSKIIGGTITSIEEYPWMAIIEYKTKDNYTTLLCGGVLISARYVLTAAHCVAGKALDIGTPVSVRLGEYNTTHSGPDCVQVEGDGQECTDGAISVLIEHIITHPKYKSTQTQTLNDIALIRLKQLVPFTGFIRPICLPPEDLTLNPPPPLDFTLFTAGWGAVDNILQTNSQIKLKVDLPFVNKEACEEAYSSDSKKFKLIAGQMCAGGVEGKDSCRGDSGGPLMYEGDSGWEVLGLVSFGRNCSLPIPGIYTKVYTYNGWIRRNIIP